MSGLLRLAVLNTSEVILYNMVDGCSHILEGYIYVRRSSYIRVTIPYTHFSLEACTSINIYIVHCIKLEACSLYLSMYTTIQPACLYTIRRYNSDHPEYIGFKHRHWASVDKYTSI
jgi:hypothetical protein